ncbi:MAG: winged helix-turn-helix transcriptional regulator [Myxococcales bacterium]|nr:winged helix-turn-helix transcriptional regulator [Myxococcales bacterium]
MGAERTDLRQLLWLVQSEISRELNALRAEPAAKSPLRPVHEQILSLVGERGQYMTDLVAGLSLPKQTVSDLVAELERSGFLQRISDPDHGVKKRVTLGTKGRKWLGQQHAYLDAVEKRWIKQVGKKDLEALRATLVRLARVSEA